MQAIADRHGRLDGLVNNPPIQLILKLTVICSPSTVTFQHRFEPEKKKLMNSGFIIGHNKLIRHNNEVQTK